LGGSKFNFGGAKTCYPAWGGGLLGFPQFLPENSGTSSSLHIVCV
jgi:hypothetical protein